MRARAEPPFAQGEAGRCENEPEEDQAAWRCAGGVKREGVKRGGEERRWKRGAVKRRAVNRRRCLSARRLINRLING